MPTFHNQTKLFREGRLSPWEPEHAKWIKQEIFNLEQDDSSDAARFKKLYEDKMAAYVQKQEPVAEETIEPITTAAPTITVTEETTVTHEAVGEITLTEKPKRGRKAKTVDPTTPEL